MGLIGRGNGRQGDTRGGASLQLRAEFPRSMDLVFALLLIVAGGLAVGYLPEASPARIALASVVLLVIPGFLLIQAFTVPAAPARRRVLHGLLGLGVSPAVVTLAALSTALFDNGFKPASIVAAVTAVCVALAAVAFFRRAYRAAPSGRHWTKADAQASQGIDEASPMPAAEPAATAPAIDPRP